MAPVLAFLLGGGVALALKDKLKGAGRSIVVGAVRAKRGMAKMVAEAKEGLGDVEAEVEHLDQMRRAGRTGDTNVS